MGSVTSEMFVDMYLMNKGKGKALVPAEQVKKYKTLSKDLIENNNTKLLPAVVDCPWLAASLSHSLSSTG